MSHSTLPSTPHFENAWVEVDGVTVGYYAGGTGLPTIVLIHGYNSHAGSWRRNAGELGGARQVLAPTMPLGGENVLEVVGRVSALLSRLLEKLGVEVATIVGHSLGGWVAMRHALQNPKKTCCLIVEDAAGVFFGGKRNSTLIEGLAHLDIPLLIVWGEKDCVVPLSFGETLHSSISRSELVLIRGAGHTPHWEQPSEFDRVVLRFVGENSC